MEAVHLKKKSVLNQKNFEQEECQNVEKQGHMYERERIEELGHSLFCHMSEMGSVWPRRKVAVAGPVR